MSNEPSVSYQILQPAEPIPEGAIPQGGAEDPKVISVKTEYGPGLIYADPEQLGKLSPVLDRFKVHGVVIPDYVFLDLVAQSADLNCTISGVEFSDAAAAAPYRSTLNLLIKAGDNRQLGDFLQELRKPIAAVEYDHKELKDVHVKLNGSGLVTFQGDPNAILEVQNQFLPRLTDFLSTYLVSQLGAQPSTSR